MRPALRHGSPVAQLVERLTVNQLVAGSSPARGANSNNHLGQLASKYPGLENPLTTRTRGFDSAENLGGEMLFGSAVWSPQSN